jgi:hypothetical protein
MLQLAHSTTSPFVLEKKEVHKPPTRRRATTRQKTKLD